MIFSSNFTIVHALATPPPHSRTDNQLVSYADLTAPNESRMADEELPGGMVPSFKRPRLGSLSSDTSGECSNIISRYLTRHRRVIIMNNGFSYPPVFLKTQLPFTLPFSLSVDCSNCILLASSLSLSQAMSQISQCRQAR